MSGPNPKPAHQRQRRNRKTTATTLTEDGPQTTRPLPLREGCDWHALTKAWWHDVWQSPMAAEFLDADVHGLYLLAELVDRFWSGPSTQLAAEIRQHRMAFGLTPLDRRRLEWKLPKGEPEEGKPANSASGKRGRKGGDTRALLRVVS